MNRLELMGKFAQYNQTVNRDLLRILRDLGDEKIQEPCGSYFKTVKGLLNHVLAADVSWFKRFQSGGAIPDAVADPILQAVPSQGLGQPVFSDLADFEGKRAFVDQALVDLVQGFTESDLDHALNYNNFQGQPVHTTVERALFHAFNHQTHHRGALSQIFDAWGVANDYSGLMRVLSP